MNMLLKSTVFVSALALASPVAAKSMTLNVQMARYSGNRAFVVAYILGPKGEYVSTVYAGGSNGRYFQHMSRWYRLFMRAHRGVDGATGASVGSGSSFSTQFTVPDKMLGKGYTLRVATAVEGQYYVDKDASVALDAANNGKVIPGVHYINQISLNF